MYVCVLTETTTQCVQRYRFRCSQLYAYKAGQLPPPAPAGKRRLIRLHFLATFELHSRRRFYFNARASAHKSRQRNSRSLFSSGQLAILCAPLKLLKLLLFLLPAGCVFAFLPGCLLWAYNLHYPGNRRHWQRRQLPA